MAKLPRPPDFKDTRQIPLAAIMVEIGRIAIVSASIEDLMHDLYWTLAGLDDDVGAVIIRDARASRLADDIVRIAKAAKVDPAKVDDLKDIFSDFTELARQRNEFVHWIWSWDRKTDRDRIDPPGYRPRHEGRWVEPEDVTKVADDLVWIEHRIAAHLLDEDEIAESKEKYGLAGAPDAPTPWLEKLPLQGGKT